MYRPILCPIMYLVLLSAFAAMLCSKFSPSRGKHALNCISWIPEMHQLDSCDQVRPKKNKLALYLSFMANENVSDIQLMYVCKGTSNGLALLEKLTAVWMCRAHETG